MSSARNRAIARRFGERAGAYDRQAGLQRAIAAKLASLLPPMDRPRILELGCGTGFLTRHLLALYPGADMLVTDLAREMLEANRAGSGAPEQVRFEVMDAEAPHLEGPFDLAVHSMTLQWLADPVAALAGLQRLLAPGGEMVYATIAAGGFPEWRGVLRAEGLEDGLVEMPELPGLIEQEERRIDYGDGLTFLQSLKAIGATQGRSGYVPLDAGKLRRALARLDAEHGARVTWRIAYGRLLP